MLQATVAALLSVGSFLKCVSLGQVASSEEKLTVMFVGVPGSLPLESKCDFYFNIICIF